MMLDSKRRFDRGFGSLNSPQMIVISFLSIVAAGTILLLVPGAGRARGLTVMEALFTSVSATCVTGLTVVDISRSLSVYGQAVVLGLIQVGGLGIMTFSTFFLYLMGRRVSLRDREAVGSTLSHIPIPNIGALLRRIMAVVFTLEAIGAAILALNWARMYSVPKALFHGVFHSVSAFCNAGFSLYSDSFEGFRADPVLNATILSLIVLGGLGFVVLLDFGHLIRKPREIVTRLSFHSKVVLSVAFTLILLGAALFYQVERTHILRGVSTAEGLLSSVFQSVTARTAGFNTLSVGSLTNSACLLLMFLMFIGAAPGSCGGGVKVTTLGILAALLLSRLRGEEEPSLFYRAIPRETVGKALTIVLSSVTIIGLVFLGLLMTEEVHASPGESRGHFLELLFESISAYGTVGLSMGITPQLTTGGRLLIILLMFVGRLGPLTMAVALTRPKSRVRYRYARGEIMVG